jgi:acetate CoA/acetoacetate CoA-transferase beta subunit
VDKENIKSYIIARTAKELKDGDIVNLGIGMPTMVPSFLPEDVKVTIQAENGLMRVIPCNEETREPIYKVDAGATPVSVAPGGCYFDSCTSFGMIRGGHVDVTVLGALEVDEKGNLSNWIIPGKKLPGMGGAMDLVVGAKKVIVTMEHTQKGEAKILKNCRLPLTALNCVNLIITEMGVMEVTDAGLVLTEINPEFNVEQVQAATEAVLIISQELKAMA